jgi:hypothetical protein
MSFFLFQRGKKYPSLSFASVQKHDKNPLDKYALMGWADMIREPQGIHTDLIVPTNAGRGKWKKERTHVQCSRPDECIRPDHWLGPRQRGWGLGQQVNLLRNAHSRDFIEWQHQPFRVSVTIGNRTGLYPVLSPGEAASFTKNAISLIKSV